MINPNNKSTNSTLDIIVSITVVADTFNRTLYVFDVDSGSDTSKCIADCAEVWPPYILSADEAAGLQAPLGSITRDNKKLQLTYDGHPVYTYAFEREVGGDAGDGIGGVWHYIEIE
jgi:predicted lipoprotein with Yx(FWY)xxD motif